jgi:hypothetical protein
VTPQAFHVSECPAATFWNKLGARGLVFAFKRFFVPQHYEFYAQRDLAEQRVIRTLKERTEFNQAGNHTVQHRVDQVSRDAATLRSFAPTANRFIPHLKEWAFSVLFCKPPRFLDSSVIQPCHVIRKRLRKKGRGNISRTRERKRFQTLNSTVEILTFNMKNSARN